MRGDASRIPYPLQGELIQSSFLPRSSLALPLPSFCAPHSRVVHFDALPRSPMQAICSGHFGSWFTFCVRRCPENRSRTYRWSSRMPSPLSKPPAIFIVLSLAAWGAISCGQQSPTSPSADIGPATAVYVMTLADEAPAPPNAPASDPTAAPSPTSPGWPPGPPPAPAPGAPVPTPPSTHFRVSLKIDPEPVPHSGKPITDVAACRNPVMKYTWYYTRVHPC